MSRPISLKIHGSALTDVGLTRSENQDACALFATKGHALVAVVADGMGGHAGGATASRILVETLHDRLSPTREEVDEAALVSAIQDANNAIYSQALNETELRGMGTTVVVLLIRPDGQAWVAHVGDSRVYRLRGDAMEQLTEDHSLVADLVKKGLISEEEAETDPRRNEILRSVGVTRDVDVDVNSVPVRPGDRFLLCSDGLTGPVSIDAISEILALYDPEDATRTLVARANEMGSPDNVTAVALHYPDPNSETDSHIVPPVPETTLSEFDLIAAEEADERRIRSRRLMVWTAVVGLSLVTLILALLITNSIATKKQSASNESPQAEATLNRDSSTTNSRSESLPYELEPQPR